MAETDNNIFSKLLFPIGVVVLMWLVKIVEVIQNYKYTRWVYFREI